MNGSSPERAWRRRGALAALAAAALLPLLPPLQRAELAWLDTQWRLLRRLAPPAAAAARDEPVVVGIDEATYQGIAEPFALWHRPLGELFAALAAAGPRGVLVDIALPERSFDRVLPGSDAALLAGMHALARAAPVVYAVMSGPDGRPRPVFAPLAAVAGAHSFASALLPLDEDAHVRRLGGAAGNLEPATMAAALAARLGVASPHADALIDYAPRHRFDYLPMQDLLALQRAGRSDELRARLGGRPLVLGVVLAYSDRLATPVPLAAWQDDAAAPPGVLVHAQALRTVLSARAVQPAPPAAACALVLACAALGWLRLPAAAVPASVPPALALPVMALLALALLSTALLRAGWYLPAAAAAAALVLTALARQALEAALALRERARLRSAFAGYVSPQVLQQLLAGELDPARPDGPRPMAFLFADLRGFTTRGQHEAARETVAMLNRYYDAIVEPIHAQGGMVDNFRGDGIMVVFGAPQPQPDAARAAMLAAGGMVRALTALNRQLRSEGRPALEMGIGIACGEAVAGQVGSRQRHDYTAIGDAVNVAARLQDQCRPQRAQAVVSTEAATRLRAGEAQIRELGEIELRGHAPVRCCALTWPDGWPDGTVNAAAA
ncbi:MAG: hypothetical protein AMXMBFR66_06200 [Pseudomonadota bacterium]|nr:CHASE2 domain-containing protein [Rubrivivax sp.]